MQNVKKGDKVYLGKGKMKFTVVDVFNTEDKEKTTWVQLQGSYYVDARHLRQAK